MNPLARLKLSAGTRIFSVRTATALLQLNFYSKGARIRQEEVKSTKPDTQQSAEPSSSQGVNNSSAASTIWSKPREIPYQPKVANFVNLVGQVKEPVRFEAAPDGKHSAAIVISQKRSNRDGSLSISVVFDGDLAQIVSLHVKQNDHVLVSGRLSEKPLQILGNESFGRFHVVADDLKFVEGLTKSFAPKKVDASLSDVEIQKPGDVVEPKTKKGASGVEIEKPRDVIEPKTEMKNVSVEIEKPGDVLEPKTKKGVSGVEIEKPRDVAQPKTEMKILSVEIEKPGDVVEPVAERGLYNKKSEDEVWRDLVNFPHQWWDYRGHKSSGLVKDKFPDFKHKSTGDPLWINTAPAWALSEIQKKEFDTKELKRNSSNREDLCKNFVENPTDWWDNRVGKRNPRAPDFKHKKTGEVLWLDQLPNWALSRLPPLNDTDTKENLQT